MAPLAALLVKHGLAFAAFAEHEGYQFADEQRFEEAYCGQWNSEQEFGEKLFDELYLHEVPEHLKSYVDYEKFSQDLFIGDYYSTEAEDGGVNVFRHL